MTERYCEGERFADLSFTEETFESCDFTDYRLNEIEWAPLLKTNRLKHDLVFTSRLEASGWLGG